MHDLPYIAAGYVATALTIGGYRWRLAVRTRRVRRVLSATSGRGRTGSEQL